MTVKKDQKPKKTKKSEENNFFLRGDFRQLSNKNVHIWDHFFSLLFPKDSESLKILDIRFQEVGAKRPLNGTSKVNRHTDGQTDRRTHTHTDRRTDKSTYRKHRPRGPMLWKSELNFDKSVGTQIYMAEWTLMYTTLSNSRLNYTVNTSAYCITAVRTPNWGAARH